MEDEFTGDDAGQEFGEADGQCDVADCGDCHRVESGDDDKEEMMCWGYGLEDLAKMALWRCKNGGKEWCRRRRPPAAPSFIATDPPTAYDIYYLHHRPAHQISNIIGRS